MRDGDDVTQHWFPRDLPGTFMRYVRTLDGVVVHTMTLLEHIPGG